jgi:hypothetical protein
MPRIRTIKPDFFTNEEIGRLSPEARLLFIGLWTLADREGRLQDRPIRIGAQLFPYDSFPISTLLDNLETAELIWRYQAEGRKCIQIINFLKHQSPHPKEVGFGLPPFPKKSPETSGKSGDVTESLVDSHVLDMDSGFKDSLSHSLGATEAPSAARESRFSLKDCRKYAESLPDIKSPGAFAKSIWRTGEDDEAVAQFLEHGGRRESDREHSARLARLAADAK